VSRAGAKRFYVKTGVEAADGGAFRVTLDGRTVKTPGGAALVVATKGLAAAVADEWAGQDETIKPDTMPLTGLVCAAIDRRTGPGRGAVIREVLRYGETDLLCYRAREPDDLIACQRAQWQPLLDWAAEALGARLAVTEGVVPVSQPPDAAAALERAVEALDDLTLSALVAATRASGSLVVGLALVMGRVDAETASRAAELDQAWQNEKWGEDSEALARRRALAAELRAVERLLALVPRRM